MCEPYKRYPFLLFKVEKKFENTLNKQWVDILQKKSKNAQGVMNSAQAKFPKLSGFTS